MKNEVLLNFLIYIDKTKRESEIKLNKIKML